MVPPKQSSNPLALAVLVLLFERPMHPYEMAATLKIRNKERSIKLRYGSLYSVIEALQEQGLIAATGDGPRGASPGADDLRADPAWGRTDAVLAPRTARDAGEGVSSVRGRAVAPARRPSRRGGRAPGGTAGSARGDRRGAAATVEEVARRVERLFLVEIDYRLALIEAERQFIEGFVQRIKEDADYVRAWRAFHAGPAGEKGA